MAASILAKTSRDSHMDEMALLYPQYGYEKHKGYPTKAHREAVLKYGPSPIQRLSFRVR
jgi:ribonuclease HII